MPDPERIAVALTHDEWQWVLSLVMNSAYIRAKPIVEATEAAVKNAREEAQAAVRRKEGEAHLAVEERKALEIQLHGARNELRDAKKAITRLSRQVDGYKGKMSQMRKERGNGHTETPVDKLISQELAEARELLQRERRAREIAERHVAKARAEWNAAIGKPVGGDDRPFPELPDRDFEIEIEAGPTDPLEQADDRMAEYLQGKVDG